MTLKEARELRDMIRKADVHCVVPLGHGPDGYFARIIRDGKPLDFHSFEQADEYMTARAERIRESNRAAMRLTMPRPRSPLEAMIDKACGLA